MIMRPGDCIVFDSHEPHCMEVETEQLDEPRIVTSVYNKKPLLERLCEHVEIR